MQRRSLLIALPMLSAACGGDDHDDRRQPVGIAEVPRNTYSGPTSTADPAIFGVPPYTGLRLFVIRSEIELLYFWSAVQPDDARSAVPKIDLQSQALVGVFTGAKPNTCHDVLISKAGRDGNQVVITYQEKIPPAFGGATCSPAFVFPFALAVVDVARDELVAFEEGPKIVQA